MSLQEGFQCKFLAIFLFRRIYSYIGGYSQSKAHQIWYNIIKESIRMAGDDMDDIQDRIFLKQIGAKIAYYRTLRDLKQADLAKRANISQSALSRIERGRYNGNVSILLLRDIAYGLEIELSLLVTFNETEKKMWWSPLSKFPFVMSKDDGEDAEHGEDAGDDE